MLQILVVLLGLLVCSCSAPKARNADTALREQQRRIVELERKRKDWMDRYGIKEEDLKP